MSDNSQNCISTCLLALSIVIIYYTRKIYDNTKDDPFLNPLNTNRAIYFKSTTDFSPQYLYAKQCICGDEILNDFCTEEQILSGCHDMSLNKQKDKNLFLKFLTSSEKCLNYQNLIMDERTQSLSEIFETKFDKINDMALGIMILVIITMSISILFIIIILFMCKCPEMMSSFSSIAQNVIIIISLISFIINFILFIILCVKYNGGDTSEYVDFLDCPNVVKKSFEEYEDVEDLKSNYKSFLITNIIYYIIFFVYTDYNCYKAYNASQYY